MNRKLLYHFPVFYLLLFVYPVFSQTWKDDSLIVRQILDTNGLFDVTVDKVTGKNATSGRMTVLSLVKLSLKILPSTVGNLDSLKSLEIDRNDLASIPTTIKNLKTLSTLHIGENPFTSIPSEIFELDSLKILEASNCPNLISLPEIRKKNSVLEYVFFNKNKNLRIIPPSIPNLTGVKCLRFQECDLRTLPNEITALSLLVVNFCYNDSLVFTQEQKNAWKIKDYKQYVAIFCITQTGEYTPSFFYSQIAQMRLAPKTVSMRLLSVSKVDCCVFNIRGQKVATLFIGTLPEGEYTTTWDRSNYAPGMYYVRLNANGMLLNRKIVVQ